MPADHPSDVVNPSSLSFHISQEQYHKFYEWQESLQTLYSGAAGGRFTWCFTPTGLGMVVEVKDVMTGKEINLTNYEEW